ncbi:PIN domain-like protein, partial [Hymenopellis radicata]
LFVFDGPGRPSIKHRGRSRKRNHWCVTPFKALLDALGYAYQTAPGEAEAELASLCAAGLIDAVMTEDVDAAMFGAPCILR